MLRGTPRCLISKDIKPLYLANHPNRKMPWVYWGWTVDFESSSLLSCWWTVWESWICCSTHQQLPKCWFRPDRRFRLYPSVFVHDQRALLWLCASREEFCFTCAVSPNSQCVNSGLCVAWMGGLAWALQRRVSCFECSPSIRSVAWAEGLSCSSFETVC